MHWSAVACGSPVVAREVCSLGVRALCGIQSRTMLACCTERRISTSARIMCSRSTAERDCGFFTTLTATCSPALSLHCGRSCLHVPCTTLAKLPVPSFRPKT